MAEMTVDLIAALPKFVPLHSKREQKRRPCYPNACGWIGQYLVVIGQHIISYYH